MPETLRQKKSKSLSLFKQTVIFTFQQIQHELSALPRRIPNMMSVWASRCLHSGNTGALFYGEIHIGLQ